jgi:hypothetical protein
MQKDAILTAQAGNSHAAAQMAATLKLGSMNLLDEDSAAYQEYQAILAGGGTYMPSSVWRDMIAKAGVSAKTAAAVMGNKAGNLAEFGEQVAGRVREMQWDEDMGARMIERISGQLGDTIGGKKMTRGQAHEAAKAITDILRESSNIKGDLSKVIEAKLQEMGMTPNEAKAAAAAGVAGGEAVAQAMNYGSLRQASVLHSQSTHEKVRDEQQRARDTAGEAEGNANVGGGFAERFADTMKSGIQSLGEFVGRLLGGTDVDAPTAAPTRGEPPTTTGAATPTDGASAAPAASAAAMNNTYQTSPGDLGPVTYGPDSGVIA